VLYDRDAFLDRVSSLVGLALTREQRIKLPHHDDIPALLLTGGRGIGKTAVLRRLAEAYGGRAPRAYLDLAAPRGYPAPESGTPSGGPQSPLLRLLDEAVWELGLGIRHTRRVTFTRLELGMLALSLWQPGEHMTAEQARRLLEQARPGVRRILDTGRHGDHVDEWVSEVLAELAGHAAPFPVDAFVKASVKVFAKSGAELAHKHRDAALHWWADHRRDMPGDSYESLLVTARDYHTGGAFRDSAERELVASFLADLTDAFGAAGHRFTRIRRPLLLLDNLDAAPAGPRFLDLVLENRSPGHGRGHRPDPLVLIATAATVAGRRSAAQRIAVTDFPPRWEWRRTGEAPDAGLLIVELTPLSVRDTVRIIDQQLDARFAGARAAPDDLFPGALPQLIHRFSAGVPLGLSTLAAAAVAELARDTGESAPRGAGGVAIRADRRFDPASLLDLPAAQPAADPAAGGPGAVVSHLLERLIPDPAIRSMLTTFSPARNAEAARALAERHLEPDARSDAVLRAEEVLRGQGWREGDGRADSYFVGDRFLRTLLLRSLRGRTEPDTAYAEPAWTQVHTTLRDHCGPSRSGLLAEREPTRLHHCLSLGETVHVVDRLQESFAASDAQSWLRALCWIAEAPGPVGAPGGDRRRASALGADQHDPALGLDAVSAVHRSVYRLLHAAWYLSDVLVAPDEAVLDRLASELRFLSSQHRSGARELFEARRNWPAALRDWRQDSSWLDEGSEHA
jgi:hypothetical protein